MSTKRFFIDLHGCAKNQVDAEIIIGIMEKLGWQNSLSAEDAHLIIINSCGFIESAKEESVNAVINARTAYPGAKILLAGCLAERYAQTLKDELSETDAVFGNGDLHKLPEIIDTLFLKMSLERKVLTPPQQGVCNGLRPKILNFPRSIYIKITEGCENFCSFCAIPIIRGKLRSRPIPEIVSEIENFVKKGFYEFNLIGQDLAAFQTEEAAGAAASCKGKSGLAKLLKAISLLKGDFKIRLLYIHPDHFSADILPVMCSDTRFLPYFDIPFQSGAEKIIKAMNRKGSAKTYLELAETIRSFFEKAKSPYGEPAIRTTFLVGFPGETEHDFSKTAEFLKKLKPLWSGGFVYSREEDTAAYSFKNRVPKKTAQKRLSELQKEQSKITCERLDGFCGAVLDILIEEIIPNEDGGVNEDSAGLALGRAWFQAPEVDGAVVLSFSQEKRDTDGRPIRAGSVVRAKIISRNGFDLNAVAQ